ncbi:TPA: hypothetical protein DF272_02390 [Candidatus Falkowbacteria bacterium]|nr:hypothetical protein [Candidatus Falkowbacteria bacterium]
MTKQEFITKVKADLAVFTPTLDYGNQMSTRVKEDAKSQYQTKLADLKTQKEKLESFLREAESTADDKWEGVSSRLESGLYDSSRRATEDVEELKKVYV